MELNGRKKKRKKNLSAFHIWNIHSNRALCFRLIFSDKVESRGSDTLDRDWLYRFYHGNCWEHFQCTCSVGKLLDQEIALCDMISWSKLQAMSISFTQLTSKSPTEYQKKKKRIKKNKENKNPWAITDSGRCNKDTFDLSQLVLNEWCALYYWRSWGYRQRVAVNYDPNSRRMRKSPTLESGFPTSHSLPEKTAVWLKMKAQCYEHG